MPTPSPSLVLLTALAVIVAPGLALGLAPTLPPVDEILATLDDLYRSSSSIARMELTVTGWARITLVASSCAASWAPRPSPCWRAYDQRSLARPGKKDD